MTISIITATYNSGKTLRDTLDSVLRQTYSDYEHIIIDGASSDDTPAIVREYEARYEGRLRYISEPGKGLYDLHWLRATSWAYSILTISIQATIFWNESLQL